MASTNYTLDIDSYIGDYAYSKRWVRNVLDNNKNKEVTCRMNSLGGSLDHGLDIADRFADHGNVTVDMFGFNASAATLATLGAKTVRMSSSGFYLIHKVMNWVDVWGSKNADELAQIIADLEENKKDNEKMDLVIAQKYAEKTGKSIDELLALMKVGGWLNATEAKEWGFVDEIINSKEKINMAQMQEKFNAFGLPQNRITQTNIFTNQITPQPMKKQFIKVNEILNVERLESTEGDGVFLNEGQIEALDTKVNALEQEVIAEKENATKEKDRADKAEADLATANNSISDKDKEIATLTTQVENLKKGPGATSNPVNQDGTGGDGGEGGAGEIKSNFAHLNAARETMDFLDGLNN